MSRRLPAGNRAVGHDERDGPSRVLRGGALVGGRGRVHLGALDGPADGVVVGPAAAGPASSITESTAPIIPLGDFLPGNTCTTRLRRLGSRLARS